MKTLLLLILIASYNLLNAQVNSLTLTHDLLPIYDVSLTNDGSNNLTLDFQIKTNILQNRVFASPDGSTGTPAFRPLVKDDALFAVNTTDIQSSIGGAKTFTSNLTVSSANLVISGSGIFKVQNGSVGSPSIVFASGATSGFSYSTAGAGADVVETIIGSYTGIDKFALTSWGQLNLTNKNNFTGQLDVNISHDSDTHLSTDNPQDGGVGVTTYGGTAYKTSTFGGRVAAGTETTPSATFINQPMAEFIGKGWNPTDGFEHDNKGIFGVYAVQTHTSSTNVGAYCAISTTTQSSSDDLHISLLVDDKGNAGLTDQQVLLSTTLPSGFGTAKTDRYFSLQTGNNNKDVGLFLQTKNAAKGLNIWVDNSAAITYLDNLENTDAALLQTRLRAYYSGGTNLVAISTNAYGTGFGGYIPSSGQSLCVGTSGSAKWIVNSSGKLINYAGSTPSNGQFPIGDATAVAWSMGSITQPTEGITVGYTTPNITLTLANDLAGVEALTSNGIAVRSGTSTWTTRTITAGIGVSITNGDGTGGNPTINAVPGAIIGGCGNQNVNASTKAYTTIMGTSTYSATESDRQFIMPYAGTMKQLTVQTSTNQGGGTFTLTIRKNGVATALSVTPTTAGLYTDSDSFTFSAGDLISFEADNTTYASPSAKILSWSVQVTQ